MPDPTVVGIDISKTHLDTYMAPAGKAARFTNDSAGFKALIAWIDQPVRSVVYEPTGPWHRAFEEALLQAGLPLARANPLQARRFAQAMGQRAKTDAVDARVLAQMGTALPLRPTEASPPTHRALEELQVARDALVTDRTAARNRQKHLRHRLLKQQNKTRLSQIDRHLAAVDAEIGKRLAEDVGLARRTEILTSIPGVSSITAAGLLTRMPELGRLDAKAVASLAGLAPVTRQSGAWQGRSFIQGGRPRVRRLLYMPALAAARCNPDLRAKWSCPSSVDTYPLGEEEESTMPKSRPPYPAAFRQQMVELVRSGRTPGELAREFEPSAEAIRNWVAQADRDAGKRSDGLRTEEHEEIRRLRRENRQLREEREILAKATAWFARETGPGRSTGS